MLVLAGLGLTEKDISLRALDTVKNCDTVYVEFYTNTAQDLSWLEEALGDDVVECSREEVEQPDKILAAAEETDVAVLVSGDPLAATTHIDLLKQAWEQHIETQVFHAPSIFTAVAETGLSLYKFGRVTTLPRPYNDTLPTSPYTHVKKNQEAGLHSLILLDINLDAATALQHLQKLEAEQGDNLFTDDAVVIVGERLGTNAATITRGTVEDLAHHEYGAPPHSIILPGDTSANEEAYVDAVSRR